MRSVKFLVLRTAWRSNSTPSVIPQVSNASLGRLFGAGNLDWNLRAFFHAATFGNLDIVPPDVIDVGPIPADAPVQRADGTWTSLDRTQIVDAALWPVRADLAPGDYGGVIVWIDSPSDAGALTPYTWYDGSGAPHAVNAAVLDQVHALTFYQHEIGHVLGYGHSHGPSVPAVDKNGNQIVLADGTIQLSRVYNDYACLMSAYGFGGQAQAASILATAGVAQQQLPGRWGESSGPLPSAAATFMFGDLPFRVSSLPSLRGTPALVDFAGWQGGAVTRRLYAATSVVGLPGTTSPVARLATLTAEGSEWMIEYRSRDSWDTGLAHSGIHIRRRQDTGTKQPIMEPGPDWRGEILFDQVALGDRDWTSPGGTFTVTVTKTSSPDQGARWAEVTVTPTRSAPKAQLSSTTDYGVPFRVLTARGTRTIERECFSGDYRFWVEARDAAVAISLVNYGFDAPSVTWFIDGQPVLTGAMTLKPRGTYPFPDGPIPAKFDFDIDVIAVTNTSLTFNVPGLGGKRDIDIACQIREAVGSGLGVTIHANVTVDGPALQWDERYFDDFGRCVLARVPQIAGANWRVTGPSDGPDMDGGLAIAQRIPPAFEGRDEIIRAIAERFGVGIEKALVGTAPMVDQKHLADHGD